MEDEIAGINNFLSDNYIKTRKKPPKEIVLDIDSTDDPTHGNQQLSMFHGYYGLTIYHPLLITELTSKLLLGAFLRAGNVHTADHVLEHHLAKAERLFEKGDQSPIQLYVSFKYKAESWSRQQKIVAKIDTLRIKLFTVRKIWVRFSSAWSFRDLFNQTYRAIAKSPHYTLL